MFRLERIWEKRNRTAVLAVSGVTILALALVDWFTKPYVSLGFLYLFPIMLSAGFLPRWATAVLGIACSILSEVFSSLDPAGRVIRLVLNTLALSGCGLFVAELVRNRKLTLESQERLRILVETSPAAVVTIDERGSVEVANRAAVELMAPREGSLVGLPIAAFLPELHHALRREEGPQFRTSMQCRGHRDNGETFMADVWFSTYREGDSPKLAAIIGDVEEDTAPSGSNSAARDHEQTFSLNSREIAVIRFLVQGLANKEIAAQMEISDSAVKNTLQQLFTKSGVRTRGQLVRVALERYRSLL